MTRIIMKSFKSTHPLSDPCSIESLRLVTYGTAYIEIHKLLSENYHIIEISEHSYIDDIRQIETFIVTISLEEHKSDA